MNGWRILFRVTHTLRILPDRYRPALYARAYPEHVAAMDVQLRRMLGGPMVRYVTYMEYGRKPEGE